MTGSGTILIANTIVYGNTATTGGGGGIHGLTLGSGATTLLNNTVADNTAATQGGGITVRADADGATFYLTNNIVWQNRPVLPGVCGDVHIRSDVDGNGTHATVTFIKNDYSGVGSVCADDPGFTIPAGNLTGDPLFLDPGARDYHIESTSPVRDMGTGLHPDLPAVDTDGQSRVQGATVDIGADELPTIPAPASFSARGIGATQIYLGWQDKTTNETGFRIERKPGACSAGGTWSERTTVGANTATYTDSGLTPGATYSYRVKASNVTADSVYTACNDGVTGPAGSPERRFSRLLPSEIHEDESGNLKASDKYFEAWSGIPATNPRVLFVGDLVKVAAYR